MTLSSPIATKVSFVTDGTAYVFPLTGLSFRDASDVVVEWTPSSGSLQTLSHGTDFTLAGETLRGLAKLTTASVKPAGVLRVRRATPARQDTPFSQLAFISNEALEEQLDDAARQMADVNAGLAALSDRVDDLDQVSVTAAAEAAADAAADSATAADAAAASAQALVAALNLRLMSPKAADPSVNDSGGALVAGMIYWSTTSSVFRYYNGTAWGNLPTYADFIGDAGAGGGAGLVPAPPAGSAAAGKFLAAGGGFAAPLANTVADEVVTAADASVSNSTTLINVSGFTWTLAANSKYKLRGRVYVSYDPHNAGFKLGLSGPAGVTMVKAGADTDRGGHGAAAALGTLLTVAKTGSEIFGVIYVDTVSIDIALETGSNGGTLALQFAQHTAFAAAVKVLRLSALALTSH